MEHPPPSAPRVGWEWGQEGLENRGNVEAETAALPLSLGWDFDHFAVRVFSLDPGLFPANAGSRLSLLAVLFMDLKS